MGCSAIKHGRMVPLTPPPMTKAEHDCFKLETHPIQYRATMEARQSLGVKEDFWDKNFRENVTKS